MKSNKNIYNFHTATGQPKKRNISQIIITEHFRPFSCSNLTTNNSDLLLFLTIVRGTPYDLFHLSEYLAVPEHTICYPMTRLFTLLTLCFLLQTGYAQNDLELETKLTGLVNPVALACPNDGSGRLFIVSRNGTIKIFQNGALLPGNFLDITSGFSLSAGGERGLLGLAFHPDFANNGKFYVNYTYTGGSGLFTRVSQFEVSGTDPNQADAGSEISVLTFQQPFGNHNGGDLQFSPQDGYLYISSGDGGSGNDPQNQGQTKDSFLGKILRIDVNNVSNATPYVVPADNPFVGDADFAPEIWAWGLRNPWRFSFDRGDASGNNEGDMWIGDVGQSTFEEIDYQPASSSGGENYGWRCYEGTDRNSDADNSTYCDNLVSVPPARSIPYNSTTGGQSITGGYVYRGADTDIQGQYIYADYATGNWWSLSPDGAGGFTENYQEDLLGNVSAFGQNETGEVFAVTLSGNLFQVRSAAALPVSLVSFSGRNAEKTNILEWKTDDEQNAAHYAIERGTDGQIFSEIGTTPAANRPESYRWEDESPLDNNNFYRLKIIDRDGSFEYSNVVNVFRQKEVKFSVFPNPTTGEFTIFIESTNQKDDFTIRVFDTFGKSVFEETKAGVDFPTELNYRLSTDLPRGVYTLVMETGRGVTATEQMILR